jgi:hypothetical protein
MAKKPAENALPSLECMVILSSLGWRSKLWGRTGRNPFRMAIA